MQKTLFALSLGIAGYLLAAHNALAQPAQCGDRARVISALQERYGETRQSIGLSQDNAVVEVFASADTGTWTILFTVPGGSTCLVAAGEHYEAIADPQPPQGEQA